MGRRLRCFCRRRQAKSYPRTLPRLRDNFKPAANPLDALADDEKSKIVAALVIAVHAFRIESPAIVGDFDGQLAVRERIGNSGLVCLGMLDDVPQ